MHVNINRGSNNGQCIWCIAAVGMALIISASALMWWIIK